MSCREITNMKTWNGDGEINGQDEHPFAFDQTPWLQFRFKCRSAVEKF